MPLEERERFFRSKMAGKISHNPIFLSKDNFTFQIPIDLQPTHKGLSFCQYEMRSIVTRDVVEQWMEENATDHYLMTRRENTIFYHENSVEIPREEPFLCSDTPACIDFAAVKLETCMTNISIKEEEKFEKCQLKFNRTYSTYRIGFRIM